MKDKQIHNQHPAEHKQAYKCNPNTRRKNKCHKNKRKCTGITKFSEESRTSIMIVTRAVDVNLIAANLIKIKCVKQFKQNLKVTSISNKINTNANL